MVVAECCCFRIVLFDPFVDAFALYGAEFAVAVFVELLEHGLMDFLALGGDVLVGGFFLLFAEFAVAVFVEFLTKFFVGT